MSLSASAAGVSTKTVSRVTNGEDAVAAATVRRVQAAIDKLELMEDQLRENARKSGLRQAQIQLRKIGKLFSASKLDPHDAKVICDPVEYIVFDGMTKGRLRRVLLCAPEPTSKAQELASIDAAVARGNVEFETVRISADGTCSSS